jgi:hypothetical protein
MKNKGRAREKEYRRYNKKVGRIQERARAFWSILEISIKEPSFHA